MFAPLWVALLAPTTARPQASIETIRQTAAARIGTRRPGFTLVATGISQQHSLWEPFELRADDQFRFRQDVTGILPDSEGFDGKTSWTKALSGVPHATSLGDRDLTRIVAYVISGSWASEGSPLQLSLLPNEPDAIPIEVRCKDGIAKATLRLDPKTYLPTRLTHWGSEGEDVWTFEQYRRDSGLAIPTRINHKGGDENSRTVLTTVEAVPEHPTFAMPKPEPAGFFFDVSAAKEIEVKRVGPYVFVRPTLNGQDEGWFFFDTGADVMVIDSAVARKLSAQVIGGESTAGVVGTTQLSISQGINFQLGPLALERPTFFEMDLAPIGKALGLPLAGICGYDFISRASIDLNLATNRMTIYEPGKAPLPKSSKWIPFRFNSNVPCFECGFEGDRKGFFDLDTGSGSGVDICTPTVEKYDLLKGRKSTNSMTGGAGGSAVNAAGTLDWFEFAGHRIANVPTGFQSTKKGVFASPFFDGNIGMAIFKGAHFVFDYQRSRLAFVPAAK